MKNYFYQITKYTALTEIQRKFLQGKQLTTKHGGVLIAINRPLVTEEIYSITFNTFIKGAVVACVITINDKRTLVLCCYFPPLNSPYYVNRTNTEVFFASLKSI